MTGSAGTISLEHQASALKKALQDLVDRTPVDGSVALHLRTLGSDLDRVASLSPTGTDQVLLSAVQALKGLVTAYHEAGHVLAYSALTPRDRVRLDTVCFHASEGSGVEVGLTYTRIAEPWWPDPARPSEVVRELACVLAGKAAEPALAGGVQLDGSDQDDQEEAAELLELLPEKDQDGAEHRALVLLGQLDLPLLPRLAAHLYERWTQGDSVISVSELKPLLISSGAIR